MIRKNAWNGYDSVQLEKVNSLAEEYKQFLNLGKTERGCMKEVTRYARENGFIPLETAVAEGKTLKPGDKVIMTHMNKTATMFVIGRQPLERGMNIVGAHIDSPRLDLKQNPLYEDGDLAYLDTHYYGGVKKYQWTALPLALHGVVVKKDGSVLDLVIGEEEDDPVIGVSDLLIHVSQNQMQKKGSEVIEGEDLNLLVGSIPCADVDKEPVKAMILKLLKDKYGMEEEDFVSAELEAVPAGKPKDFGLDRSMITGYGHDDKSCAFPQLKALLDLEVPEYTCAAIFADKEEIGSTGATGSKSRVFENAVAELVQLTTEYSNLKVRRALQNSRVLSADVTSVYDPIYASEFDSRNSARMGYGVSIIKYTGSRGKSGASDANAEFLGRIRRIFDEGDVIFQTAEIAKVDHGGGGTIAYMLARYGAEVLDCGVPVLSMHAPWEIISKADLYEAYKAYHQFMLHADELKR